MKPQDVAELQKMLQRMGYLINVSGQYDNFTRAAILNVQQRLHITPDGEPGPNTVQAIIESLQPVRMIKPQVVAGSYTATDAPSFGLPKPRGV